MGVFVLRKEERSIGRPTARVDYVESYVESPSRRDLTCWQDAELCVFSENVFGS